MVKLDTKLREMNVVNLDSLHVFYSSMFSSPPPHLENEFADLLSAIGSWPQVTLVSLVVGFWPIVRYFLHVLLYYKSIFIFRKTLFFHMNVP